MKPLEIVVHGRRTEADSLPFFQILVDVLDPLTKHFPRFVQTAVMVQPVDAHFKPAIHETLPEFRSDIVALWNEVERGAESQVLLQLGKLRASVVAFGRVHVMGENDGEFFLLGPA